MRELVATTTCEQTNARSSTVSSETSSRQSESSTAGSRTEPAQNHAYLIEKNRLLTDRADELKATLEEKDDRIDELEATTEALREHLSDCQEVLERRDQSSNPEMDEAGADDGDSI